MTQKSLETKQRRCQNVFNSAPLFIFKLINIILNNKQDKLYIKDVIRELQVPLYVFNNRMFEDSFYRGLTLNKSGAFKWENLTDTKRAKLYTEIKLAPEIIWRDAYDNIVKGLSYISQV